MAARTQKQRDQWARYNLLGTLVGLSRWVESKVYIIRDSSLDEQRKITIIWAIRYLRQQLELAALESGYKHKTFEQIITSTKSE